MADTFEKNFKPKTVRPLGMTKIMLTQQSGDMKVKEKFRPGIKRNYSTIMSNSLFEATNSFFS